MQHGRIVYVVPGLALVGAFYSCRTSPQIKFWDRCENMNMYHGCACMIAWFFMSVHDVWLMTENTIWEQKYNSANRRLLCNLANYDSFPLTADADAAI